ncbi:MAG: DUF1684 domain-containing protein [Calditrichaeota bacterium]|nr:MAG: DUF1684 domain-containing protein [Calditrichota bacterium]
MKRLMHQKGWMLLGIFALALWFGLLVSCQKKQTEATVDPTYLAEIEQWHKERVERLTSETGWLTLVGLHWLREGMNPFGSDSSNAVIFPPKAPPFMGTFFLDAGGHVRVKINPEVEVLYQGKPVREMDLVSDAEGEPTVLWWHTLNWFIIKRGDRYAVRVRDTQAETRLNFLGLERFPVDPRWRVVARFEPFDPPRTIEVPNILGMVDKEPCPGALAFEIDGKTYRLYPTGTMEDKEWFIVFGDATNGKTTYGGGRFIYVPRPGPDGTTVIDFNKAYNPPCVFTHYATCPLPPPQNRLPFEVTAGEKKYAGEVPH